LAYLATIRWQSPSKAVFFRLIGLQNKGKKLKWITKEEAASVEAAAGASDQADQEKCIKQHAQIAVRKQKCHLCHPAIDQSIAENATRNINQRDIKYIFFSKLYL
jgi:hypothetical protein